jgi:hypothetical protein
VYDQYSNRHHPPRPDIPILTSTMLCGVAGMFLFMADHSLSHTHTQVHGFVYDSKIHACTKGTYVLSFRMIL